MDDVIRHDLKVAVGGQHLSLIERGEGPAVLLGHGFLWDQTMWAPQIPALARGRRVLAPDMWGHGGSGPLPSGTASLADIAGHMLALLDARGVERCVVVGLSLGGMWAAHLAAMAPERVAGLVMLNTYLGQEPAPKRAAYGAMLDRVEATGRIDEETARVVTPLFFGPNVPSAQPDLVRQLRQTMDSFTQETLKGSIAPLGRLIFDRPDDLPMLRRISAPTLVIAGAADLARPAEESRIMAELMNAQLAVIGDCGHTSTLERPAAVTALLEGFLERIGWDGRANKHAGLRDGDGR
ncbi:alpha/beta fold hydrolase [Caulobacter sp. NIBR2454]|uniref:alpha/beta fold hydrolase n=1 Tax=Caulobacter sp. NIBR2454 TaxID=3015996 RepID=UPI0022B63252|nr:alpha/beta fold hydrolase [Caulobacter sp. NIBR2454]